MINNSVQRTAELWSGVDGNNPLRHEGISLGIRSSPKTGADGNSTLPVVSARHSLRFRLLVIVSLFVVTATILLEFYTLRQLERATTFEIEHEGRLMLDMLEASIIPYLLAGDMKGVQAHIDRIVARRVKNDIEINVMLLRGAGSEIVASNVIGNMGAADPEEHEALLLSLARDEPVVVIETPVIDVDPNDEVITATHPDYHIPQQRRIIGLTTPLVEAGQKLGSINVKSSLAAVDEQLDRSRTIILAAAALEILIVMIGLGLLLNHQLFRPLSRLTANMQQIAAGDLDQELSSGDERNEIGVMAQAFNHMAHQLAHTRKQLHKYLNPNAIGEAYRRAGEAAALPLAVEREISVLFVDIVSFTAAAERLGPSGTVAFLNRFYDLITASLVDRGGYIDKFVADEAVCIFDSANHAENAVSAARGILAILDQNRTDGAILVRIGINTGSCIVADIGSESAGRLDRTVIGDTVNVAQRLMTAADPQTALISDSTFSALLAPAADLRAFGDLQLKGKQRTVTAHQLTPVT